MAGRKRRRGRGRGSGSENTSDEEFQLREGDDVTSEDEELEDSDALDNDGEDDSERSSGGSEVEGDEERDDDEDEDEDFTVSNLKRKVSNVKKKSSKNCGGGDDEEDTLFLRPPRHMRLPGRKKTLKTFEVGEDDDDDERDFRRTRRGRPPAKNRSLKIDDDDEERTVQSPPHGRRWRLLPASVLEEDREEDDSDEDFSPEEEEEEEVVEIRVRKKAVRRGGFCRRRCRRKRDSGSVELVDEEEDELGESMSLGFLGRSTRGGRKRKVKNAEVKENDGITRKRGRKKRKTTASNNGVGIGGRRASLDSDDEDDLDFVEDEVPVRRRSRGMGRRKSGIRRRVSRCDSDFSESDLSDFEYLASKNDIGNFPVMNANCKKRRTERVSNKGKGKELEDSGNLVCSICLSQEQRGVARGLLNSCAHFFCFACIMEWSKVESKCPVCKQRFMTITKTSFSSTILGMRPTVVRVPKRDQVYQPSEEEMWGFLHPYENVVCVECLQGGDDDLMLLCDICDSPAHTYCVGLGREVPEGDWYCNGCRSADWGQFTNQTQNPGNGQTLSTGEFLRRRSAPLHEMLEQSTSRVSDTNLSTHIHVSENNSIAQASGPSALTLSARRILSQRVRILLSSPDSRMGIGSPQTPRTTTPRLGHGEADRSIPETRQRQRSAFLEDFGSGYDERQPRSGLHSLRSDSPLMPCIRSYGEGHL